MTDGTETILTAMGRESPFVDREEELVLLKGLFAEAAKGQGQVVFVAGEGGVGKTRLVEELGRTIRNQGATFIVGPSFEEEHLIPYSPWAEAVRNLIRQNPEDTFDKTHGHTISEVSRLVPELALKAREFGIKGWLSGPENQAPVSEGEVQRVRLFQGITDFLTYTSTKKPLSLFLDDLQWADASSIQLLQYFCRRIKNHKVMVIAAFRDVELAEDHPVSRLLLELNRERILKQVVLNRLTLDHVAAMISNSLGGGVVASHFAKLVFTRTGGNPFFVEEVLRSLVEQAQLLKSEEGWTLRELGRVEVPSTVRALIKQRMSRLEDETVQMLVLCAVIGTSFDYELLKAVIREGDEVVIGQLEKAVRAGLIREQRVGYEVKYIFADEQIRDFLYDELSIIRRRKLHSKIAQTMETLYGGAMERHIEELAHHYVQGGETSKAIEFSLIAGDRARRLYAHSEARKHYSNVLDLLDEEQLRERFEVLERIGDASFRLGDFDASVKQYRGALLLAERLKQPKQLARLYSKLGTMLWFFHNEIREAIHCFQMGLKVLEGEEESPDEASLCHNMARLLIITGESTRGLPLCERAIQIATRVQSQEVLADANQTLALGLQPNVKNKPEIFRRLEDSLRISLEQGLEEPAGRAYDNLDMAYSIIRSDYARAKEFGRMGVDYSKKVGYRNYETYTEGGLALYGYLPLGEWNEAVIAANHSIQMSEEVGNTSYAKPLTALALVNLSRGNIDGAEEFLNRALPLAEKSQLIERIYPCYWALGRLYVEKDDLQRAEQYYMRCVEMGSKWGWSASAIDASFELVKLHVMKRNLEKAGEFYEKIRRGAKEIDEKWAYAYEQWASGLLASARGNLKEACDTFKMSAQIWQEIGNRYNYALATLDLSKVFGNENQAEAQKSRTEAIKVFTELEAKLDLKKLQS